LINVLCVSMFAAGIREKLKAVPDWQERLRECVDKLIEEVEK